MAINGEETSVGAWHVEDPVWFAGPCPNAMLGTIMYANQHFRFFFAYSNSLSVIHSCQAPSIPHLLQQLPDSFVAPHRIMLSHGQTHAQPALELFPPNATIEQLREEAAHCKACDLWKNATQTVFGEGAGAKPKVIFVGEQPGDQEDIQGQPFVAQQENFSTAP